MSKSPIPRFLSDDSDQVSIETFVAESRKLTGNIIREREPWNTVASADAIRHFADGIGDDNPLWRDAAYAAQSRYGCRIAPPTFLISVLYPLLHGAQLRSPLTNLIAGLEFQWFRPILEGESLFAEARQTDVIEAEDHRGQPVVYIVAETTYLNQQKVKVGQAQATMAWVGREKNRMLVDRPIYHYAKEELAAIDTAIRSEVRTGKNSPPAELLRIGSKLPPIVRGPLTIGDLICWQAAIGPSYRAGPLGYLDSRAAPHTATTIPGVGWPVKYSQQHEDFTLAAQRGMPAPFDNGAMRMALLSTLLTNWMGDEGFLKRLQVSTAAPIIYGDTTWYQGTVSQKIETETATSVVVKIIGINQLGETTTTAEAEVLLPCLTRKVQPSPIAENETEKQTELNQLSESDFHTQFVKWNDTDRAHRDRLAHQLFEDQAARSPESVAVVDDRVSLTYSELNAQSNQLAHHLQSNSVGPGVIVGICIDRSVSMIVGMLAILKAGGAFLPLDANYPAERLDFMLADTQMRLLLTQRNLLERMPSFSGTHICIEEIQESISSQSVANPQQAIMPDQLAYVLYTSGSTNKPKGVAVSHSSFALYTQSIQAPLDVSHRDVYLHSASFSFSAAMRQLLLPLSVGATLVVASETQRYDLILQFELIKKCGVTIWDTVPSILQAMLQTLAALPDARRADLLDNQLLAIFTTGESLRWETVRTWRNKLKHPAKFINLYSQTETTGTVCFYLVPKDDEQDTGIVPFGRPVENTKVYLLDDNQHPVPIGDVGRLYIGGERLARGYLNRSELTAERFFTTNKENGIQGGMSVFASPQLGKSAPQRIFKTDDLARYRPDGVLEPMGRTDDQVKIRGFRIQLSEIENVLLEHPNVEETVAAVQNADSVESHIVAYFVSNLPQHPTTSELIHFLGNKLPIHMMPVAFIALTAIPLTPNGKVDRMALPTPDSILPNLNADFVAPETPTENLLAQVWCEVLNLSQIGRHEIFFELGGHSLHVIKVKNRLLQYHDIEVSVRSLFESRTIAELAPIIDALLAEKQTHIVL